MAFKLSKLLACTLLLVAAPAPAAEPAHDSPPLVDQLNAKLSEMHCPGALVGIFPNDGPAQTFALGVADVDTHAPMKIDMHMRVGSVMKPILGTVVLQLCDEGKLSLDAPLSDYVRNIPRGKFITLRMLGNNTSGLFNTIENKAYQKAIMADPTKQWTPAEILQQTFEFEAYHYPGTAWRYSNTNAVLLGMCIEKVTGHTFAEEIQTRICGPLKLTHTGVPMQAEIPEPHPSAYRNGYPKKVIGYGNTFYNVSNYSASWTGAAGNLYSTLADLGRLCRPIMMGETLSEASRKELHAWGPTGYPEFDYGFAIARRAGAIGHTGDVPGYNANCFYDPQLKTSFVVLTNLSNNADGTMPADELTKIARAFTFAHAK
jgi:D-alanyl-D-alanine carboxypeptidase